MCRCLCFFRVRDAHSGGHLFISPQSGIFSPLGSIRVPFASFYASPGKSSEETSFLLDKSTYDIVGTPST